MDWKTFKCHFYFKIVYETVQGGKKKKKNDNGKRILKVLIMKQRDNQKKERQAIRTTIINYGKERNANNVVCGN
jgi:hypothetical protein